MITFKIEQKTKCGQDKLQDLYFKQMFQRMTLKILSGFWDIKQWETAVLNLVKKKLKKEQNGF